MVANRKDRGSTQSHVYLSLVLVRHKLVYIIIHRHSSHRRVVIE